MKICACGCGQPLEEKRGNNTKYRLECRPRHTDKSPEEAEGWPRYMILFLCDYGEDKDNARITKGLQRLTENAQQTAF